MLKWKLSGAFSVMRFQSVLMAPGMMVRWFLHTSEPRFPPGSPGWRCRALRGSRSLGPPHWSQDLLTPAFPAPPASHSAPGSYSTWVLLTVASKLQATVRSLFEVPRGERTQRAVFNSHLWPSLDIWFEFRTQIQHELPVYRRGADVCDQVKKTKTLMVWW